MKKLLSGVLCSCMVMGLLSGCGSVGAGTTAESTDAGNVSTEAVSTTEESADASADGTEITIWHDGNEDIMSTMETEINNTLKDDNVSVKFEKKTGLTDQLQLYGNDSANGPDMFFYAHDSLGMLAEMGILASISDITDVAAVDQDLNAMTVEAATYKDTQYMVPVYFETLLFLYNKDLWEGDVPSTTDELYDYMEAHTDNNAGTYAVVNQHSTAYNVAPIINGFGGYILDKDGTCGLNNEDTLAAIEYNKKFAALQADGDYNTITTLFNEKKAAAIVGGPWLVSGIKDAGIDLGIKSLADFTLPNGNALAPYSGVQGFGVLKTAADTKKDAIAKVLNAVSTKEMGVAVATNNSCAPANEKAYEDDAVSADEMIVAMKQTAETAEPMPNLPEMTVLWGPAEEFLAAVNKSGADVAGSADQYQKEAESAIADMK